MADRPNILFIQVDQLTAGALRAYGDKICHSPTLDALAEKGVVFENGRGYEWLRVSQDRQRAPNPVPNPAGFWDAQKIEHRTHLQKLVSHARKQLNNPKEEDARAMLALYEPLLNLARQ